MESQRGSHRKLVNPNRTDFLIVAFHATLSGFVVKRILRQAGIDEDDFLREL